MAADLMSRGLVSLDDAAALAGYPADEFRQLVQRRFRQAAVASGVSPAGDTAPLLSVIIPVYNERETVLRVIEAVRESPVESEIIVVDDGSTDGTAELLKARFGEGDEAVRLILLPYNRGKGHALRQGFEAATGHILLIQDADLEYDPIQYPSLLAPILSGDADVVFGSRFLGGSHRVLYFWHSVGNRLLTTLSNIFTDLNLTDMESCYKVFRRPVLQSIALTEEGFGIEPEITARIAQRGWRVYEVPITYRGRTYAEGKKIGWRDGVEAVWCILRHNLTR